jgi:hypothetical protein
MIAPDQNLASAPDIIDHNKSTQHKKNRVKKHFIIPNTLWVNIFIFCAIVLVNSLQIVLEVF